MKKEEPEGEWYLMYSYRCKDGNFYVGNIERVLIPLNAVNEDDAVIEARAKRDEMKKTTALGSGNYDIHVIKKISLDE